MTEAVLMKRELDPGKVGRLRAWFEELDDREDEVIETLEDEGAHTESAFLQTGGDGVHLFYYMEVEDREAMWKAFEASDHPIDEEHEEVMGEVLADGSDTEEFELLYHVTNPER